MISNQKPWEECLLSSGLNGREKSVKGLEEKEERGRKVAGRREFALLRAGQRRELKRAALDQRFRTAARHSNGSEPFCLRPSNVSHLRNTAGATSINQPRLSTCMTVKESFRIVLYGRTYCEVSKCSHAQGAGLDARRVQISTLSNVHLFGIFLSISIMIWRRVVISLP